MGLLELPSCLSLKILSELNAKDILSVSLTCRVLYELGKDDLLWRHFCFRDFKELASHRGKELSLGVFSYRRLYTNLLYRYSWLLGCWTNTSKDVASYGGLLKVLISDWCIFAMECLPPLDNSLITSSAVTRKLAYVFYDYSEYQRLHELRFVTKFCIRLDENSDESNIYCYQAADKMLSPSIHKCSGLASPTDTKNTDLCRNECITKVKNGGIVAGFHFRCHNREEHSSLSYAFWLKNEFGLFTADKCSEQDVKRSILTDTHFAYDVRYIHYDASSRTATHSVFSRLPQAPASDWPVGLPPLVLPGLYGAMYGAHGWELMKVDVTTDRGFPCIRALKITGDTNVPAGKVSFEIDCSQRLDLDDEIAQSHVLMALVVNAQMRVKYRGTTDFISFASVDKQSSMKRYNFDDFWWKHHGSRREKFHLPNDFSVYSADCVPKSCRFRLCGLGQIAAEHFNDPACTPVVFVDFGPEFNGFGLIWLELQHFTFYYRMKNFEDL